MSTIDAINTIANKIIKKLDPKWKEGDKNIYNQKCDMLQSHPPCFISPSIPFSDSSLNDLSLKDLSLNDLSLKDLSL